MPISIKCQCGKALTVKDELAGKAVKCPDCGKPVRVEAAAKQSAAKQSAAKQPAAKAAATSASDASLDDLFDEEGFSENVASVCPACRAEMPAGAVFCVKCGFHTQTGESMSAHKTAGVDIDHGTMALDKAAADIDKADRLQREMEAKAGMPWWMLSLIIFMMGTGTFLAVLVVNARNQVDAELNFSAMKMFLQLGALAFGMVGCGALIVLGIQYAKGEATKSNIIKLGIGAVVLSGIAIGLLVAASNQ
ncbi:MAG: zinc ribbon domain-containing protein [Pirellulaceae bacterium]|nr:zinc ribbon domain-containing protein [Pirellulaceae bacterium]